MKKISLLVLGLLMLVPTLCFGQIASLGSSGESLTVVLAGAPATLQPVYSVTWSASSGGTTNAVGATTGITAATMLAGPDSGVTRELRSLVIHNRDTAAVTVTVNKAVSGTSFPLLKQTLPVSSTLSWTEESGIVISSATAVANAGAVAGTGVTVSEQGNGVVQKSVFTLSNAPLTVRDTETGGGVKIYDFPEGRVFILGATGTGTFTTTSVIASTLKSGVSCRWGVGTVTQTNATLATTEQDILPVTTFAAGTVINVANTATNASLAAAAQFDGTGTPKDAYFNVSVPTGTDIDANATVAVNGTVTITWIYLGDY